MPRFLHSFALTAALILLTACSSLKPLNLPWETTPPPTHAVLWDSMDEIRSDDWFVLLNDGPSALDWRLRAIDSATASIDMQTFLWNLDTSGRLVFEHLLAAADRGVQVKLLVDDTFLLGQDTLLADIAHHEHIEYRVFNPFKRRSNGFVTRQALNLAEFHRLDHRMHNKALIIDNQVAIIGGRNIADEYFGLHEEANFRDLEVLVGGPGVEVVARSFDEYWNDPWSFPIEALAHVDTQPLDARALMRTNVNTSSLHRELDSTQQWREWHSVLVTAHSGTPRLLVDTPPKDNPALATEAPVQAADALLEVIEGAEEDVIIVSAYLIPTPRLEEALSGISARGVQVQVLTNSIRSNNHLTAHSAYRNHIKALMVGGAELHEVRIDAASRDTYMYGEVNNRHLALHAKLLVIDQDRVFIGSANLDPRSLRLNTEMGLLIESRDLNRQLRALIARDFRRSNAWELATDDSGRVVWISDTQVRKSQPAGSLLQRMEDWLFAHLPIEGKM